MKHALVLLLLTTLVFSSCLRREGASSQTEQEGDAGVQSAAPQDSESSGAPDRRSGIFGSRGRGSGRDEPDTPQSGEAQKGGKETQAPASVEGDFPPVELPLEQISQLPEEPHGAKDARIGALTTSRLGSDPQGTRARELVRAFLAALIQGEVVTGNFYDPVTAEGLTDRLRAECDGFRVGIAERLPQGEWAVPYRCLLEGNPIPFKGTVYVTLGDRDLVVDGTLERVEEIDRVAPESIRAEETPF